jgi:hypothetical protein
MDEDGAEAFNAPGGAGTAGKRSNLVAVRLQGPDGGLADVTRTSSDQYLHLCSLSF